MILQNIQELENILETQTYHIDFEIVEYQLKRDKRGHVIVDAYNYESIYPSIELAICSLVSMIGYFLLNDR